MIYLCFFFPQNVYTVSFPKPGFVELAPVPIDVGTEINLSFSTKNESGIILLGSGGTPIPPRRKRRQTGQVPLPLIHKRLSPHFRSTFRRWGDVWLRWSVDKMPVLINTITLVLYFRVESLILTVILVKPGLVMLSEKIHTKSDIIKWISKLLCKYIFEYENTFTSEMMSFLLDACMCVCVCRYGYIYVHRCISCTYVWDGLTLAYNSPGRLGCLARKPQTSSCIHLPSSGITGMWSCTWISFYSVDSRDWTEVFTFAKQVLCQLSYHLPGLLNCSILILSDH